MSFWQHQTRFTSLSIKRAREKKKAESDMWLLKRRKSYDYMDVYVDDLAFSMEVPKSFID